MLCSSANIDIFKSMQRCLHFIYQNVIRIRHVLLQIKAASLTPDGNNTEPTALLLQMHTEYLEFSYFRDVVVVVFLTAKRRDARDFGKHNTLPRFVKIDSLQ